MRRVAILALALGVMFTGTATAGIKQKNQIDHWRHYNYTTCHTCPRAPAVIDYGPDGKLNSRLWQAAAANPFGSYILYVWETGRVYYQGGKCTSKPQWNDDYHIYGQTWNKYQFEGKNAVVGWGPEHDGHPAHRYRRVMFHFYAGWKDVLSIHKDKYVGMTLRCDGTWTPAG